MYDGCHRTTQIHITMITSIVIVDVIAIVHGTIVVAIIITTFSSV